MKERFLVTDNPPQGFMEELSALGFEITHIAAITNEDLKKSIPLYTGIVINTSLIMNKEMLAAATQLKYILRPGSGLDNVDLSAAAEKNILVIHSPEGNSDAVGEHAAGLLLTLLNHIPRAMMQVMEGKWMRKENTGVEIKNKTIGIIGYGNTGRAFAQKMSGFGARLLVYDKYKPVHKNPYIETASLEDIFQQADIVSLHIPLDAENYHFVNDSFMNAFRKPIFLINTSRGKIADTAAIVSGLKNGRLRGAALDVLENENMGTLTQKESALLNSLLANQNVIITPHIAGWTTESREKIFFIALEKLKIHL